MSATDPRAVERPKALMWRALGALEALFSDLPDLPHPGLNGLHINEWGEVEVVLFDQSDAASALAHRLDLKGYTFTPHGNALHYEHFGTVAGQHVRVVNVEPITDLP